MTEDDERMVIDMMRKYLRIPEGTERFTFTAEDVTTVIKRMSAEDYMLSRRGFTNFRTGPLG